MKTKIICLLLYHNNNNMKNSIKITKKYKIDAKLEIVKAIDEVKKGVFNF